MIIDRSGRVAEIEVTTPFKLEGRAVVTEGLHLGQIAIYSPKLRGNNEAPTVFLPIPTYFPTGKEWKSFGWRNYLEYMIVK